MIDDTTFEHGLRARPPADPTYRSLISATAPTAVAVPSRPSVRSVLVLALLLALLAGAAVLIGSRLVAPTPTPLIPPDRGVFTPTGTPLADHFDGYTATLLHDGRVLVIAGYGSPDAAEVWDPASSTFGPAGTLATKRWLHMATLLPDGRVLVVGGDGPSGQLCTGCDNGPLRSAELWDPATQTFSLTGAPANAHDASDTTTVLSDGRVLVGQGASAETWDPSTGRFEPAGIGPGGGIVVSGTTLLDGRVLVTSTDGSARIWDPTAGTFTATGHAREALGGSAATLLADGRVLVVGGDRELPGLAEGVGTSEQLPVAEIWDPATGEFSETGPMKRGALYQTATLLPDRRVLVVQPAYRDSGQSAELFELK